MARGATTLVVAAMLALAAITPLANAVDVSSCAEFAAVDRTTETEVTFTTGDIACEEYTRLSIRTDMVLKSSVGAVTFSNLGLKIYEFHTLTVEPDVVFTGITNADKSGAAVWVDFDAAGVFQGTVEFKDISVKPREVSTRIYRKGAAIYSKGDLTFEKDATFTGCLNDGQDGVQYYSNGNQAYDASSGGGGAIYQRAKGTMHFMGTLTMVENEAYNYFDAGRGEGGAFFNRGDVVVDGAATFTKNVGRDGGAIYQTTWATFTFNGPATFEGNLCHNQNGGAIANYGGKMLMADGSVFDDNVASSTGDGGNGGAIYNYDGGEITLEGSTSFTNNWAYSGGAINSVLNAPFYWDDDEKERYEVPVITYPDDTLFEGNEAETCPDVSFGFGGGCA